MRVSDPGTPGLPLREARREPSQVVARFPQMTALLREFARLKHVFQGLLACSRRTLQHPPKNPPAPSNRTPRPRPSQPLVRCPVGLPRLDMPRTRSHSVRGLVGWLPRPHTPRSPLRPRAPHRVDYLMVSTRPSGHSTFRHCEWHCPGRLLDTRLPSLGDPGVGGGAQAALCSFTLEG